MTLPSQLLHFEYARMCSHRSCNSVGFDCYFEITTLCYCCIDFVFELLAVNFTIPMWVGNETNRKRCHFVYVKVDLLLLKLANVKKTICSNPLLNLSLRCN